MDENGGSSRRKRARQGSAGIAPSEDVSSKKRRLDHEAAAPTPPLKPTQAPPTSGFRSFASAISNAIGGLGKRTTNGIKQSRSHENLQRTTSREESGESSPVRPASATMPARRARYSARPSILGKSAESIYDIPVSDHEEDPSDLLELTRTKRSAPTPAVMKTGKRGRPRKAPAVHKTYSVEDDEDMADAPADGQDVPPSAGATPPKKRRPGRPPKKTLDRAPPKNPMDRPVTASTGRRNLRGTRGLEEPASASSPVLKGILTPSRGRNQGSEKRRKTVAFGDDTQKDAEEVFFEDLPTKKKAKVAKGSAPVQLAPRQETKNTKPRPEEDKENDASSGEDDEEDDEVCEVCLKPDSEPGNEIIFCDTCDLGYHQRCHNVPTIPDGDWVCKSCLQEDISKTPKKSSAVATTPVPADAPDILNLDQHLRSLQRVLLDRCTGQKSLKLRGQDDAYVKVRQVVEQTIVAGEGNSMLLIGGRGCGKTTLVEEVVTSMRGAHREDFHVVRLDGFVHTDDKLALKEIWRQLGKEMEVEDDLLHRSNYADTMASLLALLSHPTEIMGEAGNEEITSQSVIFIINEFDMFAYHPRQTLLYNLFDIAQARKAPIAVLGCTTRLDVVEMLEKRVKSRFSHRHVYLAPPRSLPAYWEICRQGLTVDKEDALDAGLNTDLEGFDEFMEYWSRKIERLHKQDAFQRLLQGHYYTSKSIPGFLATCILPIASLSSCNLALQIPHPSTAIPPLSAPPSKLHLLASLSDLDLALLIAAARLDIIAHTDTVNFAMAYDEYSSLMGRQRVQSASSGMLALGGGVRVWGRGVAVIAWERLVDLGLLIPAGMGGVRGGPGGLEGRMYKLDVSLEEIPSAVRLNAVLARWCKEI